MKIAIYGGSFNPPHSGHVEAARTVYESLCPDKFLIIPDNVPPHKEMDDNSPSPQERMELCRLAFADIPDAEISDIELTREGKSYTADTIAQLRELYPEDQLFLVMGTDMLLSFESWYRFRYLLENCILAVLARADGDMDSIVAHAAYMEKEYSADIRILSHEPLEMSSSQVRERLRMRLGSDMLPDGVYSDIIKHRWYGAQPELSWLRERAYAMVKSSRIGHVAGCESEAVRLAMHWGEDSELAAEAAILHDITKKLSFEEQLILCEKYGIINDASELESPALLHAKTGAFAAAELFGAEKAVCEAIRWHTTGKPDMTMLEKIIYLADVIEPARNYEDLEQLRELCYEDINAAMGAALERCIAYIRSCGSEPYKDSINACVWYQTREK